jgi:predicted helicase
MSGITADQLAKITSFPKLVSLLRDNLDWPIHKDYELADVIYEYDPAELGLKPDEIAKIREISQLRPLVTNQPWGIFFISFEEKTISVSVLRRMLRNLVFNKRGSAKSSDKQAWAKNDLIFAANFGKSGERELAFVHFSDEGATNDLPVLKVLGWNAKDTVLHNGYVSTMLDEKLRWPDDPKNVATWRKQWSGAFEVKHNEAINTSKDLAIRLAALATNIRARANQLLKAESDKGPMQKMLAAFRKNLIQDLDEDGFADMFAQTISYGLLAAHISRPSGGIVADNLVDMVPKTNPFLRELFSTFLSLGGRDQRKGMDYDELGVRDVVDMLAAANMEAVLRDFGDRNPKEDPVIHFYELFLKEYDPKKRMQRGVFYTPRPIVNFIVRGVDEILRTEFGLPLGLADTTTWGQLAAKNDKIIIPPHIKPETPFVQILDPATGTGTFLVEAIGLIHKTMETQWKAEGRSEKAIKDAWNDYVPQHLLPRLTGFELMMAPYAIAHMKIGLKLVETGYAFNSDERARVLLTNALEPPRDLGEEFDFISEALAHEAKAANASKKNQQFTVVIGNPPYSKISANLTDGAIELVNGYRYSDGGRIEERGALAFEMAIQDDYVKFFGLTDKVLSPQTLRISGMITNSRYLNGIYLRGLRFQRHKLFEKIDLIDLGGQISERANRKVIDENVFDIEQGVSIFLGRTFVDQPSHISYLRVEGTRDHKSDILLKSNGLISFLNVFPKSPNYLWLPQNDLSNTLEAEYDSGFRLDELMPLNSGAIITSRDSLLLDFDDTSLLIKVFKFGDSPAGDLNIFDELDFSAKPSWDIEAAKRSVREDRKNGHGQTRLKKLLYRPFDPRSVYYDTKLIDTPSAPVSRHLYAVNNLVLLTPRVKNLDKFDHIFVSTFPAEKKVASHDRATQMFPLFLSPEGLDTQVKRPNFVSSEANRFGQEIDLGYTDGIQRGQQESFGTDYRKVKAEQTSFLEAAWDGRGDLIKTFGPRDLFDWIYAVLHAPSYRLRFAEFLKSDFPRIPTPATRDLFEKLVKLGRDLVALHLLKTDEALILKNPDIRFAGSGEARVTKGYPEYENGKVMINATRWFEDVPSETWAFHVGGYQVCEKWLKDRAAKGGKNPSPGRVLTDEDILHYRRIVTSLTETRRLMAEIDKTIEAHGGWPGAFKGSSAAE